MADDGTNGAVVHRVVGLQVEEGRLQDGSREHDLVGKGVVVGVHRLRRHAPLGFVHRLVGLGGLARPLKARGAQAVAQGVALQHLQLAVVAPLLGVADLHQVGAELFAGTGFGLWAHPAQAVDAVAKAAQQVVHQGQHALLGFGRKVLGHVELAKGLAHGAIDLVDAQLPARLLFGGATERRALEGELGVAEGLGQGVGGGVELAQQEVVAPLLHRGLGQQLGGACCGAGLADGEVLHAAQAGGLHKTGPIQARCGLGQLRLAARVVELDGVAVLDLVPMRGGQLALKQDGVGGCLCRVFEPGQCGQLRQVPAVGGNGFGVSLVFVLQVVVAVGQANAALPSQRAVGLGVLEVGFHAQVDGHVAQALLGAHPARQVAAGFQGMDLLQQGLDGGDASGFDGGFIHISAIKEGDLFSHAAFRRRFFDQALHDGAHFTVALVAQLDEGAVIGLVGRNLGFLQPFTVHGAEQVVLNANAGVKAAAVDA